MYGMVLMVAVTGSGDTASFGKRGGGCNGDVVASAGCDGGGHHFRGGCHGGFLGGRRGGNGCSGASAGGCNGSYAGGCNGSYAGGCTGTVVAAPVVAAPAPVVVAAPVVAAAPCAAPACNTCAPACDPCAKKRGGLFSRLCGKHKNKGCDTGCAAPVQAACSPCATGAAVVVPGAPVPVAMPPVTGKQ